MTRSIVAALAVSLTAFNWMATGSWPLALWMTAGQFILFIAFGFAHISIDRYKQDLKARKAAEDAARFLAGEWRKH
jgi:amino acid transporter